MNLCICEWNFKPILMTLVYRTENKKDFIENLLALIKVIELKKDIVIDSSNIWEFINIHTENVNFHLENDKLLEYLEIESLKELDNL